MTTTEVFLLLLGLKHEAEQLFERTRTLTPGQRQRRIIYKRFKSHVEEVSDAFLPRQIKKRSAAEKQWLRKVIGDVVANLTMTDAPFLMLDDLNRTCRAMDKWMTKHGLH